MSTSPLTTDRRGGALLAVLWLSLALAAIAFSVASTVRGEVERAASSVEGLKARYLAMGALDRAFNYMLYGPGPMMPDGRPRFWQAGIPLLMMTFPEGDAVVDVIPESSRLNINTAPQEELTRLLLALGVPPAAAPMVTAAIVDWRSGAAGASPFDRQYLSLVPSFRSPHASFEQIEDLLSVQGITPELFHGRIERGPRGELIARAGLKDCLSVYSSGGPLDINTVEPETMLAIGAPPQGVMAVVGMRRMAPIVPAQLDGMGSLLGGARGRFRVGGDNIYTLRATARPRLQSGVLAETRRTAAMTVSLASPFSPEGFRILRRRDDAIGERMMFDPWAR